MKNRRFMTLLAIMALSIAGCYMPIEGQVVDAETNQPIEGAVVLVEWTRTQSLGFTRTLSYKVAEVFSDKEGRFKLPGCYRPFVDPPAVAIYKKGYVTWSNRSIFPSLKKRSDYRWGSGGVYKLDKFRELYSYIEHQGFTTAAINSTIGWEDKKQFIKIFYDSEEQHVIHERNEWNKKKKKGTAR